MKGFAELARVAEANFTGDVAAERAKGRKLAEEFSASGFVRVSPTEALGWSDVAIASFYQSVKAVSPGASDYAFVNIRASAPEPAKVGRVTDALKILPVLRVSGIHLAPFFDCCLQNLYAVDSVHVVSDQVLDPALTAAGMSGDDQMRLLVDGIHRLGWKVGFDLEPHTSNFSRVVLRNPTCFRWLRLNAARDGMFDGATQEEMLETAWQARLADEVAAIVAEECALRDLDALEDTSKGVDVVRACHAALITRLIAEGYWTLPSHTWGGVGLPEFSHYNVAGGYPEYTYLNAAGEDHGEHAFGMLTPFKLYENLPLNAPPTLENPPERCEEAIALLNGIFPSVRERYGFDFVRLDYVDHVFDSVLEDEDGDPLDDVPVSDRMTPRVLKDLLARARREAPDVGAMAERMGADVGPYGKIGFDLLLGTDMLTSMNAAYVNFLLTLQRELDEGDGRCSVLAALDSHDSGHPLFWTVPMPKVVGADGMALRHFIARFSTCGPHRRPKYEVMGNQDMSTGLYEANNHPVSLDWVGDRGFNERYHALEDVYDRLKPELDISHVGPSHTDPDGWVCWFLDREDSDERLLCVAACEPAPRSVRDWVEEPPLLEPILRCNIDVTYEKTMGRARAFEIPLEGGDEIPVALDGLVLTLKQLQPRQCRLFRVVADKGAT